MSARPPPETALEVFAYDATFEGKCQDSALTPRNPSRTGACDQPHDGGNARS
jgi:hypothetical protein